MTGTSFSVSPATTTTYTITAVNANGSATAQTMVSVAAPDVTPPSVPASLVAAAISPSQISLTWASSTDPNVAGEVTSGMAGYQVFRDGTADRHNPTSTSYIDTGLTASNSYSYAVSAINAAGNVSAPSAGAAATTLETAQGPAYPLNASANGLYLADQNETPFLIHGESAWGLMIMLSQADTEQYLENRRLKGINTIMVMLITKHSGIASYTHNYYGAEPFTSGYDFSTPNEAYFANVDWVINRAAQKGIQVLLAPAYLGYGGAGMSEGWYNIIASNGTDKCRLYGEYLGNRYKDFPNIIWLMGGDALPGTDAPEIDSIVAGIQEYDTNHLITAHCSRTYSAFSQYGSEAWLGLNTSYVLPPDVWGPSVTEYERSPAMPVFLIEDYYENEHGMTPNDVQAEAWWANLAGCTGHIFGNNPIWYFGTGWQTAMDATGSLNMAKMKSFFDLIQWWNLVPDSEHSVVTAGSALPAPGTSPRRPAPWMGVWPWLTAGRAPR